MKKRRGGKVSAYDAYKAICIWDDVAEHLKCLGAKYDAFMNFYSTWKRSEI